MKYIKKINNSLMLLLLAATSALMACNEDISIPVTDESAYEKAVQSYGYLRHAGTSDSLISITLRSTGVVRNIYLGITKATAEGMTVSVAIDTTLVQAYNIAHSTQYKPFPLDLAQISNGAKLSVNAWRMKSDDIAIAFAKNTARTPEGTSYLLPIKIVDETINVNAGARTLWYMVNVETPAVNSAKASGIISFCFVEVNNVNPLNVGIYKITNSANGDDDGKPFFDICSIFAANLSYDADKGRPYIFFNENVTPILAQRDKYIKPLQDMGIKVTLAILPNGASGLGFRNLTPQGAKDLAQELKAICDAYGLDGVDFDEEYATYGINGLPVSNNVSYGRIVYEVKQAMPDKLVNVYYYNASSLDNAIVEGQPVGNFISYGFGAVYGNWTANNITGLPNNRWGPYPTMLSNNQTGTVGAPRPTTATVKGSTGQNNLNSIRSTYGLNLMYNIVGYHGVGSTELNNAANDLGAAFVDRTTGAIDYSGYFTEFSKKIYDGAEVIRDHEQYQKDWLK